MPSLQYAPTTAVPVEEVPVEGEQPLPTTYNTEIPEEGITVSEPPPEQAPPQEAAPAEATDWTPVAQSSQAAPAEAAPADAGWTPVASSTTAPADQAAAPAAPAEPPPDVREGNLGEATQETGAQLKEAAGQIMGGDILGGLGTAKDAFGHQVGAQGGDVLPSRRVNTDYVIERAMNELNTGDSFAGRTDVNPAERVLDEVVAGPNEPVVQWINQNPEAANEALTKGYTTPEGVVWEPGTTAVWERFVSEKSTPQRASLDVTADPVGSLVGLIASPIREASAVPKAIRGVAATADIVTSLGTSELVPAVTKGAGRFLRATGITAPTTRQAGEDVVEEGGSAASAALTGRREAGAVGATNTPITREGGVTTLSDPEGVAPDISYVTGRTGSGEKTVTGIVDDPSSPGVVRPVTDTDREVVLQHLNTASYEDYGRITQDDGWYREMFDRRAPGVASTDTYLETLDPDIGVPLPRAAEWTRYRDMMGGRMQAIDSMNPDKPVLRTLLGSWDNDLLTHTELAGSTVAERRLSAIEKIVDHAGMRDPTSDLWLREANARLGRREIGDFTGDMFDRTTNNLVPLNDAAQESLKLHGNTVPDEFYGKGVGQLRGEGFKDIISFKPPDPMATPFDDVGAAKFENAVEMFQKRITAFGQQELVAARPWMQALPKAGPGAADRAAEPLIQAVNNLNLFPGLHIDTADELITAIESLSRRTRMEWPQLPAGVTPTLTSSLSPRASAAPAGLHAPGSVQEALGGAAIADDIEKSLEAVYSFGGESAPVWRKAIGYQDELQKARNLADIGTRRALTASETNQLKRTMNDLHTFAEFKNERTGYTLTEAELAGWTDSQVDRVAALRTERFIRQAKGLVDSSGRTIDPRYYRGIGGKLLKGYDEFLGFRRTMSLYSTTRGPAYVLVQALGNGITLALTKPTAIGRDGLYNPVTANAIRKYAKAGSTAPPPEAVAFRDSLGLGGNKSLGSSGRDQLGNTTAFAKSSNPLVRAIGKIIAPQVVKEWADAFDTALRHGVYLTTMQPAYMALRKELPGAIDESASRYYGGITGVPNALNRPTIDSALSTLPNQFSPTQLRDALIEAAGGRSAPNQTELWRAADRAARDYANQIKTIDTAAFDEVNKIGFDFKETRADAVLGRVFMFHYWLSRASVLYLTDAARNPLHAQLWSRTMSAGQRKAEEQGWPEWQKDWMGFLSTPAGYTAFFQPSYLLGTLFFMRDESQPSPLADLTTLGRFFEGTPVIKDMMLSPLVASALYVTGGGGPDFRPPDFLGTSKWTTDINAWLDKANMDVKMFWQEQGKPKDVPNLDGRTLVTWATQMVNNQGWDMSFAGLEPVKPFDPNRSSQVNMSYYIMDDILDQNPQLDTTTPEGAAEIASMVEEVLANPKSDLYQAALRKHVDQQMLSSGKELAPVDFITGSLKHILPFGVTSQVDSLQDSRIRKNLDQKTALDDEMGKVIYDTPEGQKFWSDFSAVFDAGTPRQRGVSDYYSAIKNGTIDQTSEPTLVLEGKSWTAEELRSLPAEDRDTLAKFWMDVKNYWPEYEAKREAQSAIKAENPDAANALALGNYANQYPGGVNAFIQDTARVNPNYNRYIEGLQQSLDAGQIDETEFTDKATNSTAYTHIAGIKTSTFGYDPIKSGRGRVAGLAEGETLAGWEDENETQSVEGGAAFTEKQGQLDKELATFSTITQRLNQIDTYYGNPVGTSATAYATSLARGDKYIEPQWLYDQLKAEGFSTSEINPTDDQVGWYLKWAQNHFPGADLSTETYWNQSNISYRREQVQRINSGIRSVDTASSEDVGANLGFLTGSTMPETAAIAKPTSLRKEPGGPATTEISSGLPVTPGEMVKGSDGSYWVYVTPQGFTSSGGWVPASDLMAVA